MTEFNLQKASSSDVEDGSDHPNYRVRNATPKRTHNKYPIMSYAQLMRQPDPVWLIEGIFPQGGLSVLYGASGVGKSFIAIDIAWSIATGTKWHGHPVKKKKVLYICAEGSAGMKQRCRAWVDEHRIDENQLQGMNILCKAFDLSDRRRAQALIDHIESYDCKPDVIVIDTLARCFGGGDENSSQHMTNFMDSLEALQEAFEQATILVIHHTGKDPSKGERGHSALRAGVDTMLHLTGKNGQMTLICTKQKDAQEFANLKLFLKPVGTAKMSSCVVRSGMIGANSLTSEKRDGRTMRACATDEKAFESLQSFGPNGANANEWGKRSKIAKTTLSDAAQRLIKSDRVTKIGDIFRLKGN